MVKIVLVLILLVSFPASADLAGPCPVTDMVRPNLMLREVETHITRDANGIDVFTVAWPRSNPDFACCIATLNDGTSWRETFTRLRSIGNESRSLAELAMLVGATPGSRNLMQDPEILERCQVMADKIINPYRVVRNPDREDGARPMFTRNARGAIVNLAIDGVQIYVLPGRVCERNSIFETSEEGSWTYVTNAEDIRGISVCRQAR